MTNARLHFSRSISHFTFISQVTFRKCKMSNAKLMRNDQCKMTNASEGGFCG